MSLAYDPPDNALVAFKYGPCADQLLDGADCDMRTYTVTISGLTNSTDPSTFVAYVDFTILNAVYTVTADGQDWTKSGTFGFTQSVSPFNTFTHTYAITLSRIGNMGYTWEVRFVYDSDSILQETTDSFDGDYQNRVTLKSQCCPFNGNYTQYYFLLGGIWSPTTPTITVA